MTITYLGENHAAATNDRGSRSYTRVFKLKTSEKTERAYHVGSHPSLPFIGQVHPDDSNAYCTTLTPDPTDPWKGWTVTAQYADSRPMAEDPTDDAAIISWGSEQFQKPAVFDRNGNFIVNSAGDPFDPPNMMDDSRRVVTVQKNLTAVPAWILDYQDAVNSDSFTVDGVTIGIGLAKMQVVTVGERQRRNGTTFRTVSFTIHLQREGWLLRPLDAGFREIDIGSGSGSGSGSGQLVNIKNPGDDELPGAPVPLNGSGVALTNPSFSTCVFLPFSVYATRTFSSLPLT
jgi:hypothetical protein